jgi:hypothetical protein
LSKEPFKYYYIFGVRIENTCLRSRGKLSLDFMIDYTTKDEKNIQLAMDMINNKAVPTKSEEAIKGCNLTELSLMIKGSQYTAKANSLSVHKLNTTFKMTREDLHIWVDCCNVDEESLKKLESCKIPW